MAEQFSYHRRVEFADTDAAGIAHFTALIRYAESAEHAFLRHIGRSVMPAATRGEAAALEPLGPNSGRAAPDDDAVDWPRVRLAVDFTAPAYFEDELDIAVAIDRLGRTSIRYRMTITWAGNAAAGRQSEADVAQAADPSSDGTLSQTVGQPATTICTVWIVTVCCRRDTAGKLHSVPLPPDLAAKLSQHLIGS